MPKARRGRFFIVQYNNNNRRCACLAEGARVRRCGISHGSPREHPTPPGPRLEDADSSAAGEPSEDDPSPSAGELTPHDISRVLDCFHDLLKHLAFSISKTTGHPVHSTDYESMIDEDGAPRKFGFAAIRRERELGSIAKQKAPGLSGNGPGLCACMPDCWVEWAVKLCNIIQHSQVTPRARHVDLAHYVHKGGSDISLANHRPLALIEVFRKVFTSVIVGRMRRDWNRLQVLGSCNPGFRGFRRVVPRRKQSILLERQRSTACSRKRS